MQKNDRPRSGHALRGEQLENRWLLAGRHAVGPDQQATIAPTVNRDQQTSIIDDAATGRVEGGCAGGPRADMDPHSVSRRHLHGGSGGQSGGAFDIDRDTTIFKVIFGGSFGSLTFGNVAQPMLDRATLLEDLPFRGRLRAAFSTWGRRSGLHFEWAARGRGFRGSGGGRKTSIIYDAATGPWRWTRRREPGRRRSTLSRPRASSRGFGGESGGSVRH